MVPGWRIETPLIFFVGEAPSPDHNPGVVRAGGIEPPLSPYKEAILPLNEARPNWLWGLDSNQH